MKILPLYSRLADSTAVSGVSSHQKQTWDALSDPSVDAVVNIAVTGDGKSYAAFGAFPQGGVLALYPTNELVRDQQRQLQHYCPDLRVFRLTGYDLEKWAREAKQSKAETLLDCADADILLTNPDLFYYLHEGNYLKDYLKKGGDRLGLWGQIDRQFKAIIFDEFHLYQPSQVSGILNTLLLIRSVGIKQKYIFLSATPNPQLITFLELAGLNYRVINGYYSVHPLTGYRQINQPINLDLVGTSDRGEHWIFENKEKILNFFIENPGSKGAIILNSIAATRRVKNFLIKPFSERGLTVSENTGFTDKEIVGEAIKADLVVGTSTLDVGIDFRINFLLFEGIDGANFLQRLGRLGRHPGFNTYLGIAIILKFVQERIELSGREVWNRIDFNEWAGQSFSKSNTFSRYYQRWSPVQALIVGQQLNHPDLGDRYKANYREYLSQCSKLYGANLKKVTQEIKGWSEEAKALRISNLIVQEARAFRGTSSLQCAVLDRSSGGYSVKTYNFPGLVGNFEAFPLSKDEFKRKTKGRSPSFVDWSALHFEVTGIREKPIPWQFYVNVDARKFTGKLRVMSGLQIMQKSQYVDLICHKLRNLAIVAFIVDMPSSEVKSHLRLPLHFPIYDLRDTTSHYGPCFYSIAFDQAALMLDAYLGSEKEVIKFDMIAHHSKRILQEDIDRDERFIKQFQAMFANEIQLEDWKEPSVNLW